MKNSEVLSHLGRLNPSPKRENKNLYKMFYLYEKIRVAARSGALDRIGCARSHCTRS
jgi:hypothetical protein